MSEHFDVVVIGAGSTGAAVAYLAAKRGLSVCILERNSALDTGARWVNDVPAWMFDAAGLEQPDESVLLRSSVPETDTGRDSMLLFAGWSEPHLAIENLRWYPIDMPAFCRKLVEQAQRAGAVIYDHTNVTVGSRENAVETSRGTITANTLVDASGLAGLNLLQLPRESRSDLCAASQEVRRIVDADKARAFFETHHGMQGQAVGFTGVHGGFSVMNARYLGDRVSLLSGTIPGLGNPSGQAVLQQFVRDHAWIGERLYGGSRAIPLSVPTMPFARGCRVHVGDAARQVFAAHGSGTGSGLVAARMLVDSIAAGEPAHTYVTRWMRTYGPLHLVFDLFRRFSQTLHAHEIKQLFESGLLQEETARAGVEQRWPSLSVRTGFSSARALTRVPRLAARLSRFMALSPMAIAVARTFPEDPQQHAAGFARVRNVLARLPQPTLTATTHETP